MDRAFGAVGAEGGIFGPDGALGTTCGCAGTEGGGGGGLIWGWSRFQTLFVLNAPGDCPNGSEPNAGTCGAVETGDEARGPYLLLAFSARPAKRSGFSGSRRGSLLVSEMTEGLRGNSGSRFGSNSAARSGWTDAAVAA